MLWNGKLCRKLNLGFETSKLSCVLRCARYSGFRRSNVHAPWVVFVGLVHGILEVNFGFRHVNLRLPYQNYFDMACGGAFFKPGL